MKSDRFVNRRWRGMVLLLTLPYLVGVSCDPPELTPALAASAIEQAQRADLIYTTYLSPKMQSGCMDMVRYLRHCEAAGLVTLRWIEQESLCGEFTVDLTPAGEEYFVDVGWEGRRDRLYTTKGWRASLRTPLAVELVEVTGIEEAEEGRKKASYTWKYAYPESLEGCTRHSQPDIQEAEAFFTRSFGRWRLD